MLEVMRERRRSRRHRALYDAVWELPLQSRQVMLAALEDEQLIAGAFADRRGGICPMLAVHRRGVRAVVGSFPSAWDGFTRARRPRRATPRELDILRAVLEESLHLSSDPGADPGARAAEANAAAS